MRVARLVMLLAALPLAAAAQAPPAEPPVAAAAMDTPAQTATRKLPKEFINATPQRFSKDDAKRVAAVTRLDEILVEGRIEPEDYVGPKKAPMAQFRERLEKDRPMTPKEKTQLALCFVGLCGIYGPDGLPREPSLDERSEARTNRSTTQLNNQFRGALQ